jgi:hypothetical protein
MDLTQLNPDVLRELLKLTEQKASIQKQIAEIDARISALGAGKAARPPLPRPRRPKRPRRLPKLRKRPRPRRLAASAAL